MANQEVFEDYEEWYGVEGQKISHTEAYSVTQPDTANVMELCRDACRKAATSDARNTLYGYHRQVVRDGAGVLHTNVTFYFRNPEEAATLDPSNLNDAPKTVLGQTLTADELRQAGIGGVEADIKRSPSA